jgi:hypothetical protein
MTRRIRDQGEFRNAEVYNRMGLASSYTFIRPLHHSPHPLTTTTSNHHTQTLRVSTPPALLTDPLNVASTPLSLQPSTPSPPHLQLRAKETKKSLTFPPIHSNVLPLTPQSHSCSPSSEPSFKNLNTPQAHHHTPASQAHTPTTPQLVEIERIGVHKYFSTQTIDSKRVDFLTGAFVA